MSPALSRERQAPGSGDGAGSRRAGGGAIWSTRGYARDDATEFRRYTAKFSAVAKLAVRSP